MTNHQRKAELYSAGNLEAARIIAKDPDCYPGLMQDRAQRVLNPAELPIKGTAWEIRVRSIRRWKRQ